MAVLTPTISVPRALMSSRRSADACDTDKRHSSKKATSQRSVCMVPRGLDFPGLLLDRPRRTRDKLLRSRVDVLQQRIDVGTSHGMDVEPGPLGVSDELRVLH